MRPANKQVRVLHDKNMLQTDSLSTVPFGREMRKQFLLDDDYHNMNHGSAQGSSETNTLGLTSFGNVHLLICDPDCKGSFGTYPRNVRDTLHHYQNLTEQKPDLFIRYENPILLDECREAIAALINADTDNVVFVPNATTGVNTVMRNLVDHFNQGDAILYFDTIYGACRNIVQSLCDSWTHVSAVKVLLNYPLNDEDLLQAFHAAIDEARKAGRRVRVALFDTISSVPGVRVPFEALTAACKRHGIYSLIDGAHSIGQIPLDLTALDPDFFVSNAHKWLYTPRGCCVFYVAKRNQHLMRITVPTSHGFIPKNGIVSFSPLPPSKKSAFINNFEFVGTMDPAPYLCVPAALRFINEACGGHARVMEYMADLAHRGGKLVARRLGTCVLDNDKGTLSEGIAMVNVRLPLRFIPSSVQSKPQTVSSIEEDSQQISTVVHAKQFIMHLDPDMTPQAFVHSLTDKIAREHSTFMQLNWYASAVWVRLSAQVYLEMDDFERAAEVLWLACRDMSAANHNTLKPM